MKDAIERYLHEKQCSEFNPKAVMFDMDGVLFDSMPVHVKAWTQAFNDVDIPITEYEVYMNEGRTGASTITKFYKRFKNREPSPEEIEAVYAKKTAYFQHNKTAPAPIKGVSDVLREMKNEGRDIMVVTGSKQGKLIKSLNSAFPDIFDEHKMVTASDVKIGKPNPEPYLMALKKAGVKPCEAVVIENAPLGVHSAHAAGIFTIAVNTGILRDEELTSEGADIVFPDMKALFEAWKNLK